MARARTNILTGADIAKQPAAALSGDNLVRFPGSFADGLPAQMGLTFLQMGLHTLFLGPSGSGKTNCIFEAMRQVKTTLGPRDSMLVFDPKGDYLALKSAGDCAISAKGSTEPWNIFGDVSADGWATEDLHQNAVEIAETVFAQAIAESSQPFFPRAAKGIFSDVLATMALKGANDIAFRKRNLNNRKLAGFLLGLDAESLACLLEGSPFRGSVKYVGDGGSDQALGVFAELQEVANVLFMGDFGAKGALSVRRAQRECGGHTLFVEYDIARMGSPAYAVLIDLYPKEALSRAAGTLRAAGTPAAGAPSAADGPAAAGAPESGRVFVFLDELPLVPRLQFLQKALSFGRSKNVVVVAGVQGMGQLYELYGEQGGASLAAGFQNVFAFRSAELLSREYVAGLCGSCLKEVAYLSSQTGKKIAQLHAGRVVEDADILGLCLGAAVAVLAGRDPFIFKFDRYDVPRVVA